MFLKISLTRSGTSVGANIFEAKGASSRKDFIRFYEIALKSAYETTYWLRLLRRTYPNLEINLEPALHESEEIGKMLSSSIISLKKKEYQ